MSVLRGLQMGPAWDSSLHVQHEDQLDRCLLGPEVLELEPLQAVPSDQHSQETEQVHHQCVQDVTLKEDMQVAARVLALEAEHKVRLSLLQTELKEQIELLKIENRNLQEKLQHETRLKEDLESVKRSLLEDHQEELNKAEQKVQLLKQEFRHKEVEWELLREDLRREAEENLASMCRELKEKAESEKQSAVSRFERREAGMRHLQDQQAAQILALEKSLAEQQGRLRQLEQALAGDQALPCHGCSQDPPVASDGQRGTLLEGKEECALQLMQARNRFLEERKEIMEKFAADQDAVLRDAQEKHAHELQLLQQGHQQQLLALRTELESRHQVELAELAATLQREQQVLLEARVAELQMKHAAEVSALERRHSSSLDALESCCTSGVQAIQDQHRQALQLLRAELEEQLQTQGSSHQAVLAQESETLKLKHEKELQSAKDSLRAEMRAEHTEQLKALAMQLQGAHQAALESEQEPAACEQESEQARSLCQRRSKPLQPQEDSQVQQLKGQVLSLTQEVEECRAELERLRQRRERENQEGATLVSMLRADVDLSQSERGALRDALRRLLGVFGETLKAAVALKSRIDERLGLFLDQAEAGQAPSAAPPLEEMWSDAALLELDRALPEGAEMSSVAEISSHVCESFFMSPESTLECEQPIRRVYQSLGMAVDGLLEMALDSSRQLEEARQIHSRFEKEFNHKNEETAQVLQKHQELLECLREQRAARAELALELHRAEGLLEGFKVEKADLQEALGRKEESEQQLVLELGSLGRQLEQAAQEKAALQEERSILRSQREAWAAEVETREAGTAVTAAPENPALKKEVESLTREQVEAREQAEKDRAALLSQVRLLELELEEQLSQHRGCARQAEEEAVALKQQLAALDKQLRNQRQFMDEQAAEREHEREEFQQEIQRLEGQLRQVARLRPLGPCDSQGRQCAQLDEEIELLQEKLREKSDGFNELVIKKELADRQVLIQEEEIKHLEETNANTKRQVAQLQEELEKQKKMVKKLQEEEAVKEQQRSDVILVPLPQSRTPEGRCPMPPRGSPREGAEVLSEALQRALLQHESQVLDLKEQLEKMKDDLVSKNEEILHLKLKLDVQSDPAATSTQGLDEESAGIKVEYSRSSEVEELKAIIENLQENQERLQKDKAEEIEQLHEVIEKLQSELSLMGPVVHELSDSQVGSLRNELLCSQAQGPGGQVLQAELEAARAAKEALGQLLADQARGHSEALEALQQRLQAAEEAAARQLAELGHSVALREAEVQGMASRIQELEALLKAREATLVQRDSEIGALNRSRAAHSAELEAVLLALARFRCALEQQPRAAPEEPPELQRLRVQCVRLSRQLQALSHRFLRCQAELGQQQACVDAQAVCDDWLEQGSGGPHGQGPQDDLQPAKVLVTLKDTGFHKPESAMSVLTVCQRQLEAELLLVTEGLCLSPEDVGRVPAGMQGKNKRLEDCQLQKFDLIAQVKQLQKKLNRLVHSMAFQDMDVGGSEPQQPSAAASPSENSSSESSCDGEAADASPPVAAFALPTTPWGLIGSTKGRHSLVRMEMPCFPTREPSEAQDEPLSSQTSDPSESCHAKEAEPEKDPLRVLDLSSWSSPEVLRKDATLDPQPSFPLTPCSGALSLPSVMASPQPGADSLLQADMSELHCYPGGSAAGPALQWAGALPAEQHHHHMESTAAEKDVEDFIATASNSQDTRRSSPLGLAGDCDGSEHSGSLGFGMMLSPELGRPEVPTAGSATPALVSRGSQQPPGVMQEKEVHPLHMKALLQMVCDESHQILALSESRGLPSTLSKGAPWASLDYFSSEGQGLLEGAPEKGEKESSDTHLDWRGRFLQAVQEALEREREKLKAELQSRPSGPDPVDYSFLFERLEKVVREQGDLQEKAQKHQRLQDRSSLLSEVQALRAQLRLTHLQNQEKLQQLCAALTSAEARGSQREHQLRRQVELLAYKVEQEKCIASDLQRTLSKEQETASDVRRLLALEQSAAQDLKSENARLLESLEEVQRESLQLRSLLDGKESDLKAALEELECERGKERVLQAQQEEQQLQHLQREGQSAKALEELKISLEKQHAQNNQLCIALKHERMAKDNLQQELQIEHSRCEALLAQERSQLSQLQESLEAERSRSRELSEALQHERVLTEQLSRSTQEKPMQHTLLRKLKEEKARVQELQAVLARVQQQALHTQQQLEAQAQEHRVQLQKQQERELQLQRQRDAHKMEQLQQVVRGLRVEEEEEAPQGDGPRPGSLESDLLQGQRQELERIRQQLLCAAGLLASFVSRTVDRTIHDWTVSNEKAVSSLVQTLQGLKSELSMPTSSQKKTAAELQVQLVDLLLQDNNALTSALSTAAREEAELRRVVSRLERTLKHHAQKGCVLGRSGRSAWKHDRTVPRCSDPGRPTLEASEEANISSVKMEKLYLHYLRAESFRKALIYQKKYLLLLIGGFQDSEQETLSMIAHLGVFPSKADKKGASSRPFTRFRTAVRVVIAVLRLRFLVKKWQEVDRKGVPPQGRAPRPGPRVPQQQLSPPETRLTPPTQDEPSGLARDTAQGSGPAAAAFPSWKERSAPSPNSRLERALAASQDSEHSLTEYIHHLEMIQQRLVGVQPDSTSKKSCRQKTKQ
ncbi:Hypothetical predicted protein [Marmota monax]|uniref:Pericentrin/AKAP-450 centrosomal targeting domain-containing protein n=3 Tax=Marmota monax TaxID=9995 RepID=A0A5E4BLF8_MARMO|nr:Hypothetical predicted protein [Marmota monax]